MPDYAGYAAAVTIRDVVFNDVLLSVYRGGQIGHSLAKSFAETPPYGGVSFFYQSPQVIFSNTDHDHAILRLNGWGTIRVRFDSLPAPYELRSVRWQADLLITARAELRGPIVYLILDKMLFGLANWEFDVLSGTPFSPVAEAYLLGDLFKSQLETWLRDAIGSHDFPIFDFSSLGPFSGNAISDPKLKAVNGAMMLGFDIQTDSFATSGDSNQLHDFAGDNQIAVVINPSAVKPLMPNADQQVRDEIQQYDATLEGSLSITCEEGQFRISGRASKTGGAANFSLAAVPRMTYGRPGAYFPRRKNSMLVKARHWGALSFAVADTSVDIDRSDWFVLAEVVGGLLVGAAFAGVVPPLTFSLGVLPLFAEGFIDQIAQNITRGIKSADLNRNGPTPRVRRIGDPPTRLKVEQFEIHVTGVLIGISERLEAPPAALSGLRSIPHNFVGRSVRYEVRLPFEARVEDPSLHVRWTVIDLDSGNILLNEDAAAVNRLSFEFVPVSLGPQVSRFAVVCRVYRALGPFMTELLNQTIRLEVGPPLAPGAFVRWRYDVKNPQIRLDPASEKYSYLGDWVVRRWSKFHRTDKPCRNANHRSRYSYSEEVIDDVPFPISDINGNRYRLCDYCFFGGPGSTISSL